MNCNRCNGSGKFYATYGARKGMPIGNCFTCNGTGKLEPRKPRSDQMPVEHDFPNLANWTYNHNMRLTLQTCKVVMWQSGVVMVCQHEFGKPAYAQLNESGTLYPRKAMTAAVMQELIKVEEQGLEAIQEIGRLTGCCCICGRMLTDEESIANGIGPICLGKSPFGAAYRSVGSGGTGIEEI